MRGGYRQNAGRKKGFAAKNAEAARKLLSERLAEEIKPISEVLISQAKKGDIRAIRELFDRAWGRPAQSVQVGDDILPVPLLKFEELLNPGPIITGVNIVVRGKKSEKGMEKA